MPSVNLLPAEHGRVVDTCHKEGKEKLKQLHKLRPAGIEHLERIDATYRPSLAKPKMIGLTRAQRSIQKGGGGVARVEVAVSS